MMGLQTRVFARRLAATKKKSFERKIIAEILASQRKIVRIHVSGDFYSAAYVQKWLAIVQACPDVRFYAYTRSWRDPEIRASLERLSRRRNVRLWYSCDAETGQPARVPKRIRIAYMAMKDSDLPVKKTDLVFRVERKTVLKHQDGFLVCPLENGITHTTDCGRCSLCITPEIKDPRRYALTTV
jgi:Gene product 88